VQFLGAKILHAVSLVTACTIFASENRSYLGESEAEFKKDLARESGAQGVFFDEKKAAGRKSLGTVSLNNVSYDGCIELN
jgi:hypothetical protein